MEKYDYDAVIIGAGISGLVCGCYLAKAGMKVLIVEKNAKPGGYCTSFTRDGFQFDACVHSLGSLREGGNLRTILRELELEKRLKIKRYNPSDIIITPDYKISFWSDLNKTIRELQKIFPQEAENIKRFFSYISNFNALAATSLLNKTFNDLLKQYFNSRKLIAILSLPILGNAGLPPSKISAFPAVILYKEFLLDGGYYPKDNIQTLPDILAKRFIELGGNLILEHIVNKIKVKNNSVVGIILENGKFISVKYIVSSGDGRSTFLKLLGSNIINSRVTKKINNMIPSLSAFSIYIGLKKPFAKKRVNLWYLPDYDIEGIYSLINSCNLDHKDVYVVLFLRRNTICLFVNAPFKSKNYWLKKKETFTNNLLSKIDKIIPNISENVAIKFAATPATLYKETLNYKGATYGWAALCSQYFFSNLSKINPIKNLYLTGHWISLGFGVSGVAYLGRFTAESILRKAKL